MAAIGQKNQARITNCIAEQNPFKIASMKGEQGSYFPQTGQMDPELLAQFRADNPVYVVYSYATPVAWISSAGEWVIPDTKYSQTTTGHQNIVRYATR